MRTYSSSGRTSKSGRLFIMRCFAVLLGLWLAGLHGEMLAVAENAPDRDALSALRPGAPVAEVAKAYGSAWTPPLPHREGRVLTIDFTDGVVVRITTAGTLGSIRYNWRFGEDHPVLGLPMSARGRQVKARFPGVDLAPPKLGPFSFAAVVDNGVHGRLELGTTAEDERYLRALELYDPAAVYPAKQPVVYAAPSGEPGAPFKDVNLKLSVLSELIEKGHLDLGDPQDLYDHLLGRHFDLEAEGYEPVAEARDYLARYPLDAALLDKVTSLELDGGSAIYRYIYYFWDGESGEFDVASLEGIEHLRNLKSVRIIALVGPEADLAPLRSRGIEVK